MARGCYAVRTERLQDDLAETVAERQAFEQKLRNLRAEVRLCEASLQALVEREQWLHREAAVLREAAAKEASENMSSLEDFISGVGTIPGPEFFELEANAQGSASDAKTQEVPLETIKPLDLSLCVETDLDDQKLEHHNDEYMEEWEAVLDTTGVARCRLCGQRFPLDMDAIERHSKECAAGKPKVACLHSHEGGRCINCGELEQSPKNSEGTNAGRRGTRRLSRQGIPAWLTPRGWQSPRKS